MTKSVVVPLDGSPLAERSLATAAWLARGLGAEVHLVTVAADADSTVEATYLAEKAAAVDVDGTVTHVVRRRSAAAGISEVVASVAEPLVCMTTRGASGWAEVLLGSVTDTLVREVPVPVLLIGPGCTDGAVPEGRALVTSIDGSDASFEVFPVLAEWATSLDVALHVVTVAQTGSTGVPDARSEAAHRLVDEAAARLSELGIEPVGHVLNGAHPSDVVVSFAAALPAGVVAIGTHGRGGLSARALGHVASDVVRHSPCPVLVRRIED